MASSKDDVIAALGSSLRDVLCRVLAQQGLVLKHHVVTKGCRPGDNYLGEILRVSATASSTLSSQVQEHIFIFKCPPASAKWRETVNSIKFTRNEAAFYTQVLPKLESFRLEFARDKMLPLAVPKFFHVDVDTTEDVLVLEDLNVSNFQLADRIQGLDVNHCKLLLRELGRFHSLSLAMKILKPQQFNELKAAPTETLFSEEHRKQMPKLHLPCNAAKEMVQKRFPEITEYSIKFERFTNDFFNTMMKLVSRETELSVINHGDCWTNNILFHYDRLGHPDDIKIVDYQVIRYSSLATDLGFFLYTSIIQQTRDLYWDEMLNEYLNELNKSLNMLGASAGLVSRQQLDAEITLYGQYGVGMAILILPLLSTESGNQPSLDNALASFDDLHNNAHENQICFYRLTDVICDAIKRGILN